MQEQQKRLQQIQRRLQEEIKQLVFFAQQESNEEERRKKEEEQQRLQEEIRQKQEAMRRQREQEERRRLEAEQQRKRAQEEQRRQGNSSKKVSKMNREEVLRLPASPQKVQALIRLSGPDSVFKDNEITQDQYLGNKFTKVVKGWKRPTDQTTLVINKDNTTLGVKQGNIGDCYLISAIGALGSHLKQVLGLNYWQNPKGGYLIRFSKLGDPIYVLIDDYFPTTNNDRWVFGSCQNKEEIYVNVIEKAYAKLFGGYKNIVGGKVHEALSLLTGGIPIQLTTSDYKSNPQELFNIVKDYISKGSLLGAVSNNHEKGDLATSPKGIIQNHAYQLINAKIIDSHKLIKLRNPHGNSGQDGQETGLIIPPPGRSATWP